MVPPRHIVIAVVGPTATGKSSLAECLAKRLDGEIVSADSMQVYRGMNVGTAKVPLDERSVTYHCLDMVLPEEEFNAYGYQQAARRAIEDIFLRGKQPILCGGTGLYIRAALDDFIPGEKEERTENYEFRVERRARLTIEAQSLGFDAFHAKLAALDPESAVLIHPHNVRRVVRAFEWLEDGSSYAEQASGFDTYNTVYPTLFLGLDLPREELYKRINTRVDQMMEQGLLDEVRTLKNTGLGPAATAGQAIGYKELWDALAGDITIEEAVAQIKQATRRYAKRQQTWFRRDERIHWFDARLPLDELLREVLVLL